VIVKCGWWLGWGTAGCKSRWLTIASQPVMLVSGRKFHQITVELIWEYWNDWSVRKQAQVSMAYRKNEGPVGEGVQSFFVC
jgi:hypothetical protein